MSKKKTKDSRKSAPKSRQTTSAEKKKSEQRDPDATAKWWREAIESIVVAIILALLFRTFEAEAFVIPTGSMAPTLQGRHQDVVCPQCEMRYRVGASKDNEASLGRVVQTTCPNCRFTLKLDPENVTSHVAFTGDRILVNKFAYQFSEPKRWDVIVFKYPGNAKQNYIKRLIGLPNETIRIFHGDIFVTQDGQAERIARKSPDKLVHTLQMVHDTHYQAPMLIEYNWPARWRSTRSRIADLRTDRLPSSNSLWTTSDDRRTYRLRLDESQSRPSWLRYRHVVPSLLDWDNLQAGRRPGEELLGELITDFYAYNASVIDRFLDASGNLLYRGAINQRARAQRDFYRLLANLTGKHWVGDLAFEAEVRIIENKDGHVHLDLVEAGRHHRCQIDVSTGEASLTISTRNGDLPFEAVDNKDVMRLTGKTDMSGPGQYTLRYANVDDQVLLWVNDRLVEFHVEDDSSLPHEGFYDSASFHASPDDDRPYWSPEDPGDLSPLGIGGRGVEMEITRLRTYRDVYYVATSHRHSNYDGVTSDYDWMDPTVNLIDEIHNVISNPQRWAHTELFSTRRSATFELGEDEFFPLGDNSPASKDARLWYSYGSHLRPEVRSSVDRKLLTGKAFFIYWPHPWYLGTRYLPPVIPNIQRMGRIR